MAEDHLWLANKLPPPDVDISFPQSVIQALKMRTMWIRWRLALLVTVFLLALFLLYYRHNTQVKTCFPARRDHPELNALWYYCNKLEAEESAYGEGTVPRSRYHLEIVHGLIRHGDRFRIHSVPNYVSPSLSCKIEEYPELVQQVSKLKNFTRDMEKPSQKLKPKHTFAKYPTYPNEQVCQVGHLTPLGAAQHIRNGDRLRKVYIDQWQLLGEDINQEVLFVSTQYQRTFQSGVAFLYGLLPSMEMSTMDIIPGTTPNLCYKQHELFPCECTAATLYKDATAATFGQMLPRFLSQDGIKAAFTQISEAMKIDVKSMPRASQVMDIGMVHMCNGLILPSSEEGFCMEPKSLRQLLDGLRDNARFQLNRTEFHRLARIRILPLLNAMLQSMEGKIQGDNKKRFVLYSGHDTTIDPLLAALNISNGIWPMYASRVMFELYSTNDEMVPGPQRYFLRVLFNGRDVTGDVIFCRGKTRPEWEGMCPFDNFKDFIRDHDGLKDLKQASYISACDNPVDPV